MNAKAVVLCAGVVMLLGVVGGATLGKLGTGGGEKEPPPTLAAAATVTAPPRPDASLYPPTYVPDTSTTPSVPSTSSVTPVVVELEVRLGIEEAYRWDIMLDLNGAVAVGVVRDARTAREASDDGLPGRLFTYFGVEVESWISAPTQDLPDANHVTIRQRGGADGEVIEVIDGDELLEVGRRYLFLMVPHALQRPGLPYKDLTTAAPYATFKIVEGVLHAREGFDQLPIPQQLNGMSEADAIQLVARELAKHGKPEADATAPTE